MKVILTPNLNPPFNLRRMHPNPDLFVSMEPEAVVAHVVARNKETGQIPCETDQERAACLALYVERHPALPVIELPPIGPHYIVDESDLPGGSISEDNDYFFDAWEWIDGAVVEAREKCETIHMGRIRVARNVELAALDVPYMRALESGDPMELARIAGLKQQYRDIPQVFDLAPFPDPVSLKAAWPPMLKERPNG
jgi:hypothetical protein